MSLKLSESTSVTFSLSALVVGAGLLIAFTAWLWSMKWTQDRLAQELSELRQDVRWIQHHLPGAPELPGDQAKKEAP